MADEITLSNTLKAVVGDVKLAEQIFKNMKVDQTNSRVYMAVHDIGTSEESITSFGDVATPGLTYLYNLDPTNYVEWGPATTVYMGQMTANDGSTTKGVPFAEFYGMSGMGLYLKANTAPCKVLAIVCDR